MKNKSTLVFYSFLITCCFTFLVNAQEQKSNIDFSLNIIQNSSKSNIEKEHDYVLELTNNSNLEFQYSISIINDLCSDKRKNKLNSKKDSNIKAKIYLNKSSKKSQVNDIVTLQPNKALKLYLNIQQKESAELDTWNCTTIRATKLFKKKSKKNKSNIYQSVIIKTFAVNPNNPGH